MNKNLFIDMEVVEFFMKKRNMRADGLAAKLEISTSALENYMKGEDQSNLPGTLPWRFAHALGVPVKILLEKYYH